MRSPWLGLIVIAVLALAGAAPGHAALVQDGLAIDDGCCCPAHEPPTDDADRLEPRCGCRFDEAPQDVPAPAAGQPTSPGAGLALAAPREVRALAPRRPVLPRVSTPGQAARPPPRSPIELKIRIQR